MTRRVTHGIVLALVLVLACLAVPALAAPEPSVNARGGDLGIGALSDRYESLNKLGNSLTDEESVVIATRVGVLVSANRALNDSEVSFTGEAVNDVLEADDGHKWANIMGSSNSVISLYLTDDQARHIQNVGGYHMTGTSLKITGTYHIACPEHMGELDVHATSVEVVDNGGPIVHMVSAGRLRTAFVLCALAGILLAAFLVARRAIARRAES